MNEDLWTLDFYTFLIDFLIFGSDFSHILEKQSVRLLNWSNFLVKNSRKNLRNLILPSNADSENSCKPILPFAWINSQEWWSKPWTVGDIYISNFSDLC